MRQLATAAIVSVFVVTTALAACPPGSVQGLNQHRCYVLGNNSVTWLHAERQCAALKGHLASVSSQFTNRFLYTLELKGPTHGDYWLGGYYDMDFNDKFPRTVWQWSDSQRFVFSDWAKGEPVHRNQGCLAVDFKTGNWRSAGCNDVKGYVCKVPEVKAATEGVV